MRLLLTIVRIYLLAQGPSLSRAWLGLSWDAFRVHRRGPTIGLQAFAMKERVLLTRNITNGESWLPAMGKTVQNLDEISPKKEGESWRRAIQHANAILDLYNDTQRGLSEDLVMSTLENVVKHSTDEPHEMTGALLEDVECLVWRLRDFDLIPSLRVLEALWEMQLFHRNNQAEKASKQVGRQVNLLAHWREWSSIQRSGYRSALQPPQESYLVDLLRYAADENVSMSFTLWELYESVSQDPKTPCGRIVYSYVLRILAQSPSSWSVRQRRVCNDMITRSKLQDPLRPSPDELRNALEAAAITGRAQDAAWLLRTLGMCPEHSDKLTEECRTLFLKALLHSDEPGSLMYMEELILSGKWENDTPLHWKMLLRKYAQSGKTGCGARAERAFRAMENRNRDTRTDWTPDVQSLYITVHAYLNEPNRSLLHVLDATRLVKRCMTSYDLYCSESEHPIRIFDTLLAAFNDYARTDPKAVIAADELFRYFMVQHRDGRVRDEEPDRFILGHILRHWNRQFKKDLLQKGAHKSLEYFRLCRTLFDKNIISSPPDLFNVRQLLGTLARSGEPGFGAVANETLTDALTMESPIHPYALGHMYWCVIKSYCNEYKVEEAMAILNEWESAFSANPSAIRLTGAPYQTIINTLTIRQEAHDPEIALQVVYRLEKQYLNGNNRVRLRSKLYKEALQCCQGHTTEERIHQSFRRMNFTTLS